MNPLFIIIILICSILLLVCLITLVVSFYMKKTFFKRGDGSISIRYQLPSELKGVDVKHGQIKSKNNIMLSYITYCKHNITPKALILVIHGIGYGHFYLLPMIDKFVSDGYMVLAYDQYASGSSQGRIIKTMTRGSIDIKYVLKYIESNSNLNKYPLYVFGHSWGGYVAGFSLKYSHSIQKVVDVSGFDNEGDFASQMSLFIKLYNLFIVGINSFVRVRSIFKKTTAKVYYLQGKLDNVVNPKFSGEMYRKYLKNKTNIVVELLQNKGHTPFNDDESQKEQIRLMSNLGLLGGVLLPIEQYVDFRKISKVDESVYKKIISFYESN